MLNIKPLLSRDDWGEVQLDFFDFKQDFMPSSDALVDAVIQAKEGLFAVLQAAWDYGCA